MSEKRELGDVVNGSDPSQKRRKLDELSEEGPLTQEDVIYFQKEAIFRQMKTYQSEVVLIRNKLRNLDQQYLSNNSKLLVLNNWVDQFIEFIASLVPEKANTSNTEGFKDLFVEIPNDIKDDEFIELLNKKKSDLANLISKVSPNSETIKDNIKEQLTTLDHKYHNLKMSNQKLANEHSLLKTNFEELSKEYQNFAKKAERSNSATLKRINGLKSEGNSTAASPNPEKEASIPPQNEGQGITSNNTNIHNHTTNNKNNIDTDTAETLMKQVDEFKSTIEAQQKIIDENLELHKSLNSKILELSTKESQPQQSREQTAYPKDEALINENKDLNIKYKESLQKYDVLVEKFNNLETERTSDNDLLNSKFEEEKVKITTNFGKLESDLIRIRTARDELLSKISVLESEKTGLDVTKQLQSLIEVQKEQIENIQFSKKLDDMESETISSNDVEVLKKNNTILTNELKELEKAFKHLQGVTIKKANSAVDSESIVNKLKVEKTKADQKYFAAMRSKDSILQENKTLKAQVSKLNELMTSLKDSENLAQSRFKNMEEQIKTLKKTDFFKNQEIDQVKLQLNELVTKYKDEVSRNKEIKTLLTDFKTKNEDLMKIKSEQSIRISKLESNVKSQDTMIQRFKSTGVLEDQNEADSFRSLIYCSLCSKNWKNTAIKVCGHVFCEECAKERIAARMRKCPTCNKQFSSNDLLTIHL